MTHLTEIQPVEAFANQVSTPKIWDRATPKVSISDYICAPFTPIMEVVDKDVYPNGQTWLLVKPNSGSYTEEWLLEAEDIPQPAQPQPLFEEEAEFKQGFQHGQLDVAKRLPAIYTQASCQYCTGYLKGYNSTPTPQQTKTPATPHAWSVNYDGEYWYKVWVDRVLVGKATTSEKAEQIAQKYIAGKKFWQEHRERMLAAYAH